MSKLILLLVLTISFSSISQSSSKESACTYCTSIEAALENPSNVKYLDLRAKGIREIPEVIDTFVNLQLLDLSENYIESVDYSSFKLSQLRVLDLSNNPGLDMMSIAGIGEALPNLESFNISHSSVQFISPELANVKSLVELDVSNNSLRYIPDEVGRMKFLKRVDANNNEVVQSVWLEEAWNLEELDLSGNKGLNLNDVGIALLFHKNLVKLGVSLDTTLNKGLPNSFEELTVRELMIKSGSVYTWNGRLSKNKNLKKITFEDCTVSNGKSFYGWMNRMTNVEVLEFNNMGVPSSLNTLESIDELRFVNTTFKRPDELASIDSDKRIVAIGIGGNANSSSRNSEIAETESPSPPAILSEPVIEVSEEMISNQLKPIIKPEAKTFTVSSTESSRVETESTSFDIPSEAFLMQSGEVYTGEVKIELTEYMDPIQNALAGAPMVFRTEDGTNEVFSSAGMFEFNAFDNQGRQLNPNPTSTIQVQMQDLQPTVEADMYSFSESSSNWESLSTPDRSNFNRRRAKILDSLNQLTPDEIVGFKAVPQHLLLKYKRSRKDPYILSFEVGGRKEGVKRAPRDFVKSLNLANADQRWIAHRRTWKIDTTMDERTIAVLTEIKRYQRKAKRYTDLKDDYENSPRVIKDLKLTPDLENDNFRLSFRFRDTLCNFPVIANFGGSIARVQAKEKRNFNAFEKASAQARKEMKLLDDYRSTILSRQAKWQREQRADVLAGISDLDRQEQEYLRFVLPKFGMVNCDYFSRNRPNSYVRLDTVGIDEDGNRISIARNVRSIYLSDNVFVSTSSQRLPVFKRRKSIILFVVSAVEIAIIKGWDKLSNGIFQPRVERVNIEGLSPDEVNKRIMSFGK